MTIEAFRQLKSGKLMFYTPNPTYSVEDFARAMAEESGKGEQSAKDEFVEWAGGEERLRQSFQDFFALGQRIGDALCNQIYLDAAQGEPEQPPEPQDLTEAGQRMVDAANSHVKERIDSGETLYKGKWAEPQDDTLDPEGLAMDLEFVKAAFETGHAPKGYKRLNTLLDALHGPQKTKPNAQPQGTGRGEETYDYELHTLLSSARLRPTPPAL